MAKAFSILALVLLLAACAHAPVHEEPVAELRRYLTTYGDVIEDYGRPAHERREQDGTRIVTYLFLDSQHLPSALAELAKDAPGGKAVSLRFDSRGLFLG